MSLINLILKLLSKRGDKLSNYIIHNGELYHYGVVGMKWGVHRAQRKQRQNERLKKKALDYDIKSSKLTKKSEKIHAEQDLGGRNRAAKKAANYEKKASKLAKKALKSDNSLKKSVLESRSETLKYKAAKSKMKANRISKTSGYGVKAMKYSVKSDKVAMKAAKMRKKIAKNNRYTESLRRKASTISKEDLRNGYSFVNDFMNS